MAHQHGKTRHALISFSLGVSFVLLATSAPFAAAATSDNPQSGSVGLEGTISSPPPTQAATISNPTNGQVFTSTPITVSGLCPTGLLVRLFSNNVFVGAVQCAGGSYSLQADLFGGRNDLVARVYDALDQAGPDSNVVSVTFNDAQFITLGSRVSLSSIYAKRGANPGDTLTWPIILSGGSGPYAISVDWGDGKPATLQSEPLAGTITISHTYAAAGVYRVIVRASDANGATAFLQLVGVGNGQISQSKAAGGNTIVKTQILWWPALLLLPFIAIAFWLGRRHELYTIRKQLEQTSE